MSKDTFIKIYMVVVFVAPFVVYAIYITRYSLYASKKGISQFSLSREAYRYRELCKADPYAAHLRNCCAVWLVILMLCWLLGFPFLTFLLNRYVK